MILPNICIPELSNKKFDFYDPDTFKNCRDKNHFLDYPFDITYQFNVRGFRDQDWPNDLSDVIWCLGDSATLGIGSPNDFSWPSQVEKITGKRTINLGIRATNNFIIATIAFEILKCVKPLNILILWTFFERRPHYHHQYFENLKESSIQLVLDDEYDHLVYFQTCLDQINRVNCDSKVIHGFAPYAWTGMLIDVNEIWQQIRDPSWPASIDDFESLPIDIKNEIINMHTGAYGKMKSAFAWQKIKNNLNKIDDFVIKDTARDGWHWDKITNHHIAQLFYEKLTN